MGESRESSQGADQSRPDEASSHAPPFIALIRALSLVPDPEHDDPVLDVTTPEEIAAMEAGLPVSQAPLGDESKAAEPMPEAGQGATPLTEAEPSHQQVLRRRLLGAARCPPTTTVSREQTGQAALTSHG